MKLSFEASHLTSMALSLILSTSFSNSVIVYHPYKNHFQMEDYCQVPLTISLILAILILDFYCLTMILILISFALTLSILLLTF